MNEAIRLLYFYLLLITSSSTEEQTQSTINGKYRITEYESVPICTAYLPENTQNPSIELEEILYNVRMIEKLAFSIEKEGKLQISLIDSVIYSGVWSIKADSFFIEPEDFSKRYNFIFHTVNNGSSIQLESSTSDPLLIFSLSKEE